MALTKTVEGLILADDFNRSNSTTIGGDWTERSGDWEILSNRLSITDSTTGRWIDNSAGSLGEMFIQAQVRASATAGYAAIVGRADWNSGSPNGYMWQPYIEGYWRLFVISAGSFTQLGPDQAATVSAGTAYPAQIYTADGVQEVSGGSVTHSATNTAHNGQNSRVAALRAGAVGGNTRTRDYDDFVWCKTKNLTVTGLGAGSGRKAKVLNSSGSVVAEATESGGTATIDCSRFGGATEVVPGAGWADVIITDASDNFVDGAFAGASIYPGQTWAWDGDPAFDAADRPAWAAYSGLDLWLSARGLMYADGAAVGRLYDRSGNGRDVVASTGTGTFRPSGTSALDERATVESTTNTGFTGGDILDYSGGAGLTVFAVVDLPAELANDSDIIGRDGSGDRGWKFMVTDAGRVTLVVATSSSTIASRQADDVNLQRIPAVLTGRYNGSTGELSVWVNGVLDNGTLNGSVPATIAADGPDLGVFRGLGWGANFVAHAADIAVFGRALTDEEREAVEAELIEYYDLVSLSLTEISPDVKASQGVAAGGGYRYTLEYIDDNDSRIHQLDAGWALQASNTSVVSGVNPIKTGDLAYYDGKLYLAMHTTGPAVTRIGVFDASSLVRISADTPTDDPGGTWPSGLAVDPDRGRIWGTQYTSPWTQMHYWDLATETYLGFVTLSEAISWPQGISYNPYDGMLWTSHSDLNPAVDSRLICRIDPDTGKVRRTYRRQAGYAQGLDATLPSVLYWAFNDGANQQKVRVYGMTTPGPAPTITATAISSARIDLTLGAAIGGTEHRLYRSTTEGFTPSPGTLLATYGATPASTYEDTGLVGGTTYYYALVGVVGVDEYTARANATTLPVLSPPTLRVGSITHIEALLGVDTISEYLEVEYLTTEGGVTVDSRSLTGPDRFRFLLTGLTAETEYVSAARVRYTGGWSAWSDEVTWSTLAADWYDPDALSCPPIWSGVHINPDGNHWDRIGRGFFRPLPGQPLRGTAAQIVFRWHHSGVNWNIQLSDDLGSTWSTIATNPSASTADGDRLIPYRITLDTTGYADGPDYRLRAVSTNTDPVIEWESMSFHVDNAADVHWWKAQWGDAETDKWGKLWAQTGQNMYGGDTGHPIWLRGRDGGLVAYRGHDYSVLVDRAIPESYGADVTARWYIWSGEGGFQRLQGRDDIEFLKAGIAFFAKGTSKTAKQGIFVGFGNEHAWVMGCCSDYLTSTTLDPQAVARQTQGSIMTQAALTADPTRPVPKMYSRAMVKPLQVVKEEVTIVGPTYEPPDDYTGGAFLPWPVMTWRDGPEPGDGVASAKDTCARRWEMYSQRTRVEVDPLDFKRVRIRARLDGPGVQEPSTGYWHIDEWVEFAAEWERGTTGVCSQQLAASVYGTPGGARIFYSLSVLPLEPDEPPLIPPVIIPPFDQPQEGAPCTVILQVYDDDRETVRWEVGDDRLHPQPYLCVPEHYGEQELDIVNGAATIGQVEVAVIDRSQTVGDQASGWLTERLQLVHGRRNRLLRFIDYELGWVTIADGPATAPRMDDSYAAYRWTIRDTRETERKVEAFVAATSSWLLPMGLPDGWGQHINGDGDPDWLVPPQDPLTGTYHVLGGDYPRGWVDLRDYWPGPWSVHPSPNQRPVGDQTVPEDVMVLEEVEQLFTSPGEPMGDPRPVYYEWPDVEVLWRPALSGDDWTVIQPTDYIVDGESYAKPAGVDMWWPPRKLTRTWDAVDADGNEVRASTWIMLRGLFAEGTFPADTDEVEIAIRFRGKPTEFAPLHLEGLTTGQLLKNLYDGVYSRPDPITGEVVATGIRYHEADLLQMQDPVLLRLTEPVDDARAWAEKMIYAPTGWVPALNNDGEISPKSQVPPISFAGELLIDNSVTEPQPDWSAGDRIVNVLSLTYPRYYRVDAAEADSIDRLEKRDVTHEWRDESMIDRHDIQKAEYDGSAFAAVGDEYGEPVLTLWQELGYGHALDRKLYVFDRYKNGTPIIEVPVMRTHCATLRAGDWVRVDLSWFPENTTGRRGMLCGGQILAIHDVDCAWRILLIERVVPLIEGS